MLRRSLGLLGLWLLLVMPSLAQQVPPPLQGWQDWVLHDVPQHDCPFLANQMPNAESYQCAWPGALTLAAGADGASLQHERARGRTGLDRAARRQPELAATGQRERAAGHGAGSGAAFPRCGLRPATIN